MSRYDAFLDDGGRPEDWEKIRQSGKGPATKALFAMLDGEKESNSFAMAYMARIAAHECGYTEVDDKNEKE